MYIKLFILSVLIFATLNPKDVSAASIQPPKVYADGIVLIEHTERLKAIPMPELTRQPIAEKAVYTPPVALKQAVQISSRYSSSGNTYSPGYCTYYAKQRRPDLPNNLGNANTWFQRAAAQGIPVGSEPRVGAIGETKAYMHVVYVEAVNGDTVTVSEANYKGRGVVSTRTAPASEFRYIY